MSAEAEPSAYGAETFAEGNWYHELLEDGLALSYRGRARSSSSSRERAIGNRVDAFSFFWVRATDRPTTDGWCARRRDPIVGGGGVVSGHE